MEDGLAKTFKRTEGIEGAPMRDESILYVPSSEAYCVLNRPAAALWEALATPSTEDQLAALLVDQFDGATMEGAMSDVRAALEQMHEMSLVQEVS